MSTPIATAAKPNKYDEEIVVVPRAAFDPSLFSSFLTPQKSFDAIEKVITQNMLFIKRKFAEEDETYKQIIPYFIFKHADKLFLMERSENAGEKRLKGMLSLGIGGHLRKDDTIDTPLKLWGMREFHEEVSFDGELTFTPIGILNDEATPVGRVHIGIVYLIEGSTPNIGIKSEHKNGILASFQSIQDRFEDLEPWSKICFAELAKELA